MSVATTPLSNAAAHDEMLREAWQLYEREQFTVACLTARVHLESEVLRLSPIEAGRKASITRFVGVLRERELITSALRNRLRRVFDRLSRVAHGRKPEGAEVHAMLTRVGYLVQDLQTELNR